MKLTIVIPTYNRPKQLLHTLELLLPQMTNDCFLLILDNHSDIPVESYVIDILNKHPNIKYNIIRNRVNIGGDSNIMRCFEYCETDWLWTLGDDDEITNSAINTILNDIKENSDALYINYYSPNNLHPVRNRSITCFGLNEFLINIDSLASVIFMSSNVYNINKLNANRSSVAYKYTYSCSAQVVIVILNLTDDKMITIFSNKIICISSSSFSNAYTNMNITILKGISVLMDLPLKKQSKNLLISQLDKLAYSWIKVEAILKSLLIDYYRNHGEINIRWEYKRLYNIYYRYTSTKNRLKSIIWLLILYVSPKMTFNIIRAGYLFKRSFDIKKWIIEN
jgi:glycosyltransferase involved in cell wall biosynthesis